ncbi:magnesium-translocating P-type ATPase [Cryobacterium sp. TMT2-23]|uniref:magnesium-translocating P-type ATPase n=1 Tax=Cryobacterium sp. TMT2-23 TaxID=1259252 RepID=UPI00106CA977|nr:magnesium-translocating P-type ATPase [Cryobacterium sp. TMT2-23]TFD18282.1 magnesium-translocating P-type ATPase [Cryobacterium sp. TMT2-23]
MPDPAVQEALARFASRPPEQVLADLGSSPDGLSDDEATRRLTEFGPNAVRTHAARAWPVLVRQLRSPILILLFLTAALSLFLGDVTNSIVIAVILVASVGLGFVNEFRAEQAVESLHSRVSRRAVVVRDGAARQIDVVELVAGDVVHLGLGSIVPADIRVLRSEDLLCDESILTGESLPVEKNPTPVPADAAPGDLASCVLMGTVIQTGSCMGVVVATGGRAEFGRIALGLGETQPQTEFQLGLKRFSFLLVRVAVVLTSLIFLANLVLQRPLLESLLFSLAIAVGITPQLLPAVVSTSLATGARRLAQRRVLVKRLVCIEDLGDMDVLVTDKTGTLTEGRIRFTGTMSVRPEVSDEEVAVLGLVATEADFTGGKVSTVGQNPLDAALWQSPAAAAFEPSRYAHLDVTPFDHHRRMTSVLVRDGEGTVSLVAKGAPEDLLRICIGTSDAALALLAEQFDSGARVIAVASRPAVGQKRISIADEHDLVLAGFLLFADEQKANARESLDRLEALGITVKVATGDNARVTERACADLGVISGGTLTGVQIDGLSDAELSPAAEQATIFARVSPEQKARVIRMLRANGRAVGFLGDGVNDALALHDADVGISVDSATDVAKDAADIVLLEKDLGVLADGVVEGRRTFANTIKYVLMGTSSNFGNMFSAAVASVFLSFLPMLPGQILLNNLLYDAGQLAIPSDRVDEEQVRAPAHWNIGFIRRFMLLFGGISSLFDFATFALMLLVFNAGPGEFRSGWFIESIATQTLIIFSIRTRRVPFLRSRPSTGLTVAAFGVVAIGAYLPFSALGPLLGFAPLPAPFFLALAGLIVVYLLLVEFAKLFFYARVAAPPVPERRRAPSHRIGRRAAAFSVGHSGASGFRPASSGPRSRA